MKIEWKTCLRVGLSVFLLYLCIHYWSTVTSILSTALGAASPLLTGCIIAYIINILMSFYEKHYFPRKTDSKFIRRSRRPVCIIAAFLTLIAIILVVLYLVVPQLISAVKFIIAEVPAFIENLLSDTTWIPQDIKNFITETDWQSYLTNIMNALSSSANNIMNFVADIVSGVFSALVSLFLGIVFSVYLLMGKERLKNQGIRIMKNYFKPKWTEKILYFLSVCNDCFHRYIVGQSIEAVILGTLCTIGMWIFQLPYAPMIGALIAFTALIPVAGAYIGAIVGALMIMTVSPVKAVIFVVFIIVLQQIEGNLIYPKVVGSSIGLPGLWVLTAVTIGGGLFGVFGMLIGVPLSAVAYRILKEDVTARESARNIPEASQENDENIESPPKADEETDISPETDKKD